MLSIFSPARNLVYLFPHRFVIGHSSIILIFRFILAWNSSKMVLLCQFCPWLRTPSWLQHALLRNICFCSLNALVRVFGVFGSFAQIILNILLVILQRNTLLWTIQQLSILMSKAFALLAVARFKIGYGSRMWQCQFLSWHSNLNLALGRTSFNSTF